jgi:pyruvate,orthophosphate dikinase
MPGMMDTILNVGLDDESVEGLAATTGNRRFAYDSYRRLIQMYGETVDGIDGHRFEEELSALKRERGVDQDVDLTDDDLAELVARFKRSTRTRRAARSPRTRASSSAARSRPSSSRGTRRARRCTAARTTSRRSRHRRERRPDGLRQQGRAPRRPASRSRATRRPGDAGVFGEFLVNAQGEDVVAGIRTPEPLARMEEVLPEAFEQYVETIRGSRSTTATSRTPSSRSRRDGSTCCRRAPRSGRPRRR